MTAADLAEELEVSERTIYRDLTALSTAEPSLEQSLDPPALDMPDGGEAPNARRGIECDEAVVLTSILHPASLVFVSPVSVVELVHAIMVEHMGDHEIG